MGRKKGAMDVLLTIYKSRPDLQSAFPEVNKGDYKRLLGWAVTCGVTIDPAKESLDPVFSDLVELIKPLRYAENLVNQNILKNMYGDKFIFDIDGGFLFTIAHSLIISDPSLILARSPLLIDSRSFSSFFVDSYRYFETISAFLSVHSWYKSKATAVNTILT